MTFVEPLQGHSHETILKMGMLMGLRHVRRRRVRGYDIDRVMLSWEIERVPSNAHLWMSKDFNRISVMRYYRRGSRGNKMALVQRHLRLARYRDE